MKLEIKLADVPSLNTVAVLNRLSKQAREAGGIEHVKEIFDNNGNLIGTVKVDATNHTRKDLQG